MIEFRRLQAHRIQSFSNVVKWKHANPISINARHNADAFLSFCNSVPRVVERFSDAVRYMWIGSMR